MARLDYVVLAQAATIDRETNNLSIHNVIEEIQVPAKTPEPGPREIIPGALQFVVVAVWLRSDPKKPETQQARLQLFGPASRKPLGGGESTLELTGSILRTRSIWRLDVLPYRGPGIYTFEMQLKSGDKWRRAGRRTLLVKKAD